MALCPILPEIDNFAKSRTFLLCVDMLSLFACNPKMSVVINGTGEFMKPQNPALEATDEYGRTKL
jgi:hypothetical protein